MSKRSPPLRELLDADFNWTPRQRQVLSLLAEGRTNGEIASELSISLDGAKWHVREVLAKLNVDSRDEAAEYWRAYNGWPRKLQRMFGTTAGIAVLKWGTAVVTVAATTGVVAFAAAAVMDDSNGSAISELTPAPDSALENPTATTVPVPTPGGPSGLDDAPSPPPFNTWINRSTGVFEVRVYDDRRLPPEEKAENPAYNPRWGPFNACLEEAEYIVREDMDEPFSQRDMNRLVGELNEQHRDREANLQIETWEDADGLAAAFLRCGESWLELDTSEFAEHGIERLEPGVVPEPW